MAVRLSALSSGRLLPPVRFLVLIPVKDWVDPKAVMRLEVLDKLDKSTSSGLKPATFWFVAQCLNQLRYRVLLTISVARTISRPVVGWTGKSMEGGCRNNVSQDIFLTIAWRDWGKPQKFMQNNRCPTEIQTGDFPKTSQKCYGLNQLSRCHVFVWHQWETSRVVQKWPVRRTFTIVGEKWNGSPHLVAKILWYSVLTVGELKFCIMVTPCKNITLSSSLNATYKYEQSDGCSNL
jgi:hypothetical protein